MLVALATLAAAAGRAATLTLVDLDDPGEGFNDPTAVAPVTGNGATTLGGQRQAAFRAAAAQWGRILESNVTIRVEATMDSLACNASTAVLGLGGPESVHADFPNAPIAGTWFTQAEANSLAGADLQSKADISAAFNKDVDSNPDCLSGVTWWYGIGAPAPAGTVDFYTAVLHEIAHGLGFLTLVDIGTGAKFVGANDAFMLFLEDHSTGKHWGDASMSDAERAASATDSGDLHWTGPHVVALASGLTGGVAGGHVQVYAPSGGNLGAASHWDPAITPDGLMEPNLHADTRDILTTAALLDIGWNVQTLFRDGFETGSTADWTSTTP